MSSVTETPTLVSKSVTESDQVGISAKFDWLMIATMGWLIGGLNIDIWAHINRPESESFFSPWHGIMYSGFAAHAAILYVTMLRNQFRGYYWLRAVPRGYELSLLGAIIFIGGGLADMLWHTVFGVEANVEALYSPTHLAIATGGGIMLTGPMRSMWHRGDPDSRDWLKWLPTAFALAFLITLFGFFTTGYHPVANPISVADARYFENSGLQEAVDLNIAVGVIGVVISSAIITAVTLIAVKRWKLLPGTITLMFSVNAFMMGFVSVDESYPTRIVVALAASGLAVDALRYVLDPSVHRLVAFRIFAALTPFTWAAFYFAAVESIDGIPWSVHLWAGTIVEAGVVGWLVSYLLVPPRIPQGTRYGSGT